MVLAVASAQVRIPGPGGYTPASGGGGFSLISSKVVYGQSLFSPWAPWSASVAVNNAGAKIVVVAISYNTKAGVSMGMTTSLGNTCTPALPLQTAITGANSGETIGIYSCTTTQTGTDTITASDSTDTLGSGIGIVALPYSDSGSPTVDQTNSNLMAGVNTTYGANPVASGSITPTANGEALVTAFDASSASTTVNSGMTILARLGTNYGGTGVNTALSVAALIQTTAGTISPFWSTDQIYKAPVAAVASFKP